MGHHDWGLLHLMKGRVSAMAKRRDTITVGGRATFMFRRRKMTKSFSQLFIQNNFVDGGRRQY
jgi:hypothetical protein